MAAFTSSSSSVVQHHFLIDTFLNSNISFSQFCHPLVMENNLDHSTNVSVPTNHDPTSPVFTLVNKTSMDSSSIVTTDCNIINNSSDQLSAQKVTKTMKGNNIKKRKLKYGASLANSAQSKDMRQMKEKKQKKVVNTADAEKKNKNGEKKENEDEPPIGYIHVRARRGQATDSHSLAERVRRERISERMNLLQSLVPGCDKVTGKALMLDEIINYVQSLQYQVEFLSSKLASLNPMTYNFGMDLESFMVTPNQSLNSLPSPQQCSPTAVNNNPILENISSNAVLFQPVQLPNTLPQGNRQVLWEVDEQRQKIINQSDFSNNNLFSFH